MIPALWLLASLSSLADLTPIMDASPLVALLPFRCEAMTDVEVRPALAVEIRGRLLHEPGPVSSDAIAVSVFCREGELILSASRPGRVGPPLRRVPLATVATNVRPRTVALAIAELVRASTVEERAEPVAVQPAPPLVADERVHSEVAIGPALISFASRPGAPLGGAHVRWSHFWMKPRGNPRSSWWFGPAIDFNASAASFWSGDGSLTLTSLAMAGVAERRFGHLVPQLAVGNRFGLAAFRNEVGPNPSDNQFIGGGFAELGLGLVLGPIRLRAATEIDFPLGVPGSFCSGSACVDFSGFWMVATLDAMMVF